MYILIFIITENVFGFTLQVNLYTFVRKKNFSNLTEIHVLNDFRTFRIISEWKFLMGLLYLQCLLSFVLKFSCGN